MLTEIIFSGFGGQGILFAGKCLAYSAMILGAEISWLPSYGPEMRGGTANCSVCISDEPIGSPLVTEPDILIAMNTPSFDKFEPAVKPEGVVIADSNMTERKSQRKDINCFYVPAAQMAQENELAGMANIILLGKLIKECPDKLNGVTAETAEKAFRKIIPVSREAMILKNISALTLGMTC